MRILILGAGGVGGYLGGRLIEAGAEVRFLVRPARAELLGRAGLVIRSPLGDWSGPAPIWRAEDAAETPADVIILSCKSYDLASALDAIAPAVTSGVALLPFLNGIAHLDVVKARFPEARLWGGVAQIAATLGEQGEILHLNELSQYRFGALEGSGADPRAAELERRLEGSAATAGASDAILQEMWEKVVFLATLAGATCLMRGSVGEILTAEGGEALLLGLLKECETVATAEGFAPRAERMERYVEMLSDRGSPMTASMLRDVERGGPTEGEHILGDLVERARRRGIATPLLALARAHLQTYEARRAGRPE